MKNKLRIENENKYEIEVNDDGETISFNIDDPSLMLKVEKAYEDVNKISNFAKSEMALISKRKDIPGKILSKNNRDTLRIYDKMYNDMRKAMDGLLGKGACQKIFGDTNYLNMFDDLFKELIPHFENMGLNAEKFIDSIKSKYAVSDEDEETLEA